MAVKEVKIPINISLASAQALEKETIGNPGNIPGAL